MYNATSSLQLEHYDDSSTGMDSVQILKKRDVRYSCVLCVSVTMRKIFILVIVCNALRTDN